MKTVIVNILKYFAYEIYTEFVVFMISANS